jgi:hypothetical protein
MSPRVSRHLHTPRLLLPIALCGKDPLLLPMVSMILPHSVPYLEVNCRCRIYTANTPLLSRKKLSCPQECLLHIAVHRLPLSFSRFLSCRHARPHYISQRLPACTGPYREARAADAEAGQEGSVLV